MRLAIIGRLLPLLAVPAMRGASISTAAFSATAVGPIAFTFVALEQESEEWGDAQHIITLIK